MDILLGLQFIKRSSEYFLFLQTGLTITLAVVAAIQTVVIVYGLQKFYQTWSRTWVAMKSVFNLLKSKLKKEKAEEKKNIQMKLTKSSLKRQGQIHKLCMLRPAIEISVQQDFNKILLTFVSVVGDVATEFKCLSNQKPTSQFLRTYGFRGHTGRRVFCRNSCRTRRQACCLLPSTTRIELGHEYKYGLADGRR